MTTDPMAIISLVVFVICILLLWAVSFIDVDDEPPPAQSIFQKRTPWPIIVFMVTILVATFLNATKAVE